MITIKIRTAPSPMAVFFLLYLFFKRFCNVYTGMCVIMLLTVCQLHIFHGMNVRCLNNRINENSCAVVKTFAIVVNQKI